jgi:hypothetical protein
MFDDILFSVFFLASAAGTIWVYWGVPVRKVALYAILVGIVFAIPGFLVVRLSGVHGRSFFDFALGCGIASGGLIALFLNLLRIPAPGQGNQ